MEESHTDVLQERPVLALVNWLNECEMSEWCRKQKITRNVPGRLVRSS